ncbi:MAG: argininosuccinate lyase [Streptosporangiales bacterium]|nr:argininosuccinate lyase [Streptosporangiales bacterium]
MSERISRERLQQPPGEVYTQTVLEPSFRFMQEHYYGYLLETNKAWVSMLVETGIVPADRGRALLQAVLALDAEGPDAIAEFNPAYEYFYSHVEAKLAEHAGDEAAGEVNIGRTRPEPLTRLVLRSRILDIAELLSGFTRTLLDLAEREADTVMPQWTHFQPAQPATVGHYLLGMVAAFGRDHDRLVAAYGNTNQCTLGCGALAGTSYPVDRALVADLLGFDGVRENTIDCVSSGDYVLETTAALANMLVTASRLAQDLYMWSTDEFGLVEIGDEFSGSSSMMPQKKNAYPFEYVRARGAHAIGEMTSAYGTLHNTNFQDLKDVEEEIVPPAFRLLDEAEQVLRLLDGTIRSMTIHPCRMLARAASGFATATELAAVIHRETGVDARTAHRVVGHLVLRAVQGTWQPAEIDAAMVAEAAREVLGRELTLTDEAVHSALDPTAFVAAHKVPGGPAPESVAQSLATASRRLEDDDAWAAERRDRLAAAEKELAAHVARHVG